MTLINVLKRKTLNKHFNEKKKENQLLCDEKKKIND